MMIKQIEKSLKKKWIMKWSWCLETRGLLNNRAVGIHAHIRTVVIDDKYSYECKREMYNTFKHLVGNVAHVNAKYSNIEGAFIDYVKGIKKGEPKENAKADDMFRAQYGLEDYYSKEG